MSGPLSFTLNGQSYSITSTTVNPLSNAPATNGNWLYYLYYYSNTIIIILYYIHNTIMIIIL